jgi:two-component system, LytTR family, response regulator
MLRVVLCDDERLALQRLRQLIAPHPNFQIVGEANTKAAAIKLIRKERPDALFLDVQMPGATGFDLLKALHPPPKTVMVTAYAKYALQAFDLEAIDYLIKPVTPQRFAQALHRLVTACTKKTVISKTPYSLQDRICLRTPHQSMVVPIDSIPLLQADGDFTRIHIPNSAPLMICQPLGSYEKILPFPPFARIDRSHIINLNHITRLERKSRDEANLVLEGVNDKIPIGRAAQLRLKDFLPKQ